MNRDLLAAEREALALRLDAFARSYRRAMDAAGQAATAVRAVDLDDPEAARAIIAAADDVLETVAQVVSGADLVRLTHCTLATVRQLDQRAPTPTEGT